MSQDQNIFQNDSPIDDKDLYLCFQLMKESKLGEAEQKIQKGLDLASQKGNSSLEGLYLSAMGVLHKIKKDYKKSYQFYQKAEKLLPEDPSLKMITATLLIEEFAQYDTALRKLEKILKDHSQDPALWHHAMALKGMTLLLMGKKEDFLQVLKTIIASDFSMLRSTANINFKFPELLVKKQYALQECLTYLKKAKDLALEKRELVYQRVIETLIAGIKTH